jgi:hypothetical protein
MKRSILAVGAWSVGPRAQVSQAQRAAGERVRQCDVGGAVVGHQALHGDPVRGVEGQRAAQEADRGAGFLVCEDFDVACPGRSASACPRPSRAALTAARRSRLRSCATCAAPRSPARNSILAGPCRLTGRRRRAICQARLAIGAVATRPLARGADARFGARGRLRERPLLLDDALTEQHALPQAERRVSVQHHPVSSLGLSWLDTAQPPRRPG